MCTLIILTLSSLINSCSLIYRFHRKEYMALVKDHVNLVSSLEHGPCGRTEGMNPMMMALAENRHMVYILLHLFRLNPKLNGWASSSEMQMPSLLSSPTKPTTRLLSPMLQLAASLKCISSPKVTPNKSSKLTKT